MTSRVVVTGGAGFIGTHTVEALLAAGARVLVIDDLRHASWRPLPAQAELVHADVRAEQTSAALLRFRPHAVLHLAAQGGVNRSWREPVEDASLNVLGTVAVLEAARRCGCRRVVLASSGGALYGDAAHLPAAEDTPPAPRSPYGTAKLCAEVYLRTAASTSGLQGCALRYGNVYGPGQDGSGEAGVVAITCTRLLQGLPPLLRGDGQQTRDFVYVADVVAANLAALQSDVAGAFNVGTGAQTSVASIVDTLRALAGDTAPVERVAAPSGEVRRSCLDPGRAQRQLGWRAITELQQGLAETWASFRAAADLRAAGAKRSAGR